MLGGNRPFANAVNNKRSDKLDSAMWREAFENRRCIIPVSSYYEYTGAAGVNRAHLFTSPDVDWLWPAGEILSFAPSTVELAVAIAANPLKRKPTGTQGESF